MIHLPYVNNIQSEKETVVNKSFDDLKYTIRAANILFKPAKIFINMHLVSTKKFDEKRLDEILSQMPKNMKLLIETV